MDNTSQPDELEGGNILHSCPICRKNYSSVSSLQFHLQLWHKAEMNEMSSKFGINSNPKHTLREKSMPVASVSDESNDNSALYITDRNVNTFKCKMCDVGFSSKHNALRHLQTKHNKVPTAYKCSKCPAAFEFERSLNRHVKKHQKSTLKSSSSSNNSRVCSESKSNDNEVLYTESIDGTGKIFKCTMCQTSYRLKCFLQLHLRNKHGKFTATHKCHLFPAGYESQTSLRKHMKAKHDKGALMCVSCNMTFKNRYRWRLHMQTVHKGMCVRPRECAVCGEAFATAFLLQSHVMECHTLSGQSASQVVLQGNTDQQSEQGISNDDNEVCSSLTREQGSAVQRESERNATTSSADSGKGDGDLLYSVNREPGNKTIYKCKLCDKTFTRTLQKVFKHLMRKHGLVPSRLKCRYCSQEFTQARRLNDHMKLHENSSLNHSASAIHRCKVCPQKFRLFSEIRTHCVDVHNDLIRYRCVECQTESSSLDDIKAHVRCHHLVYSKTNSIADLTKRTNDSSPCHQVEAPTEDQPHAQSSTTNACQKNSQETLSKENSSVLDDKNDLKENHAELLLSKYSSTS